METKREQICSRCGIYNSSKLMCNPNLYINPNTNEVSTNKKDGFIKGCGCFIPSKIKRETNHCPAGKW